MSKEIKIMVVGCGNMGSSHARAYHKLDGFALVGLVDKNAAARDALSDELGGIDQFDDFDTALIVKKPDAVAVCTYPGTHAELTIKALKAGCHVFCEKPLAPNIADALAMVEASKTHGKKLVIGYILRVHPSWKKFIEIAQGLGKPLVMRMNLNQQSSGKTWATHRRILESMSPIVDCGVHYVDVMCQMTRSKPVAVSAIGARLSDQIDKDMYNYGQLQVRFEDGSIGWYEVGWGPMMSEVAFFVKDVIGPKGCVNIMDAETGSKKGSDDIDSHTKTNRLKIHYADRDANDNFTKPDEIINTEDEPDHQGLCDLEQQYFLNAIRNNVDLSDHLDDAVNSLKIVLACDEAVRTGKTISLS
ncbi:MAG: Gfo/Idh/MocA family oxidoreductase [Cyclobacteriaceae bacterium]|nr:Gfo/Idh/MocA family oxidoreductase [Cyclobacteriaceae bacterium]